MSVSGTIYNITHYVGFLGSLASATFELALSYSALGVNDLRDLPPRSAYRLEPALPTAGLA